MVRGSCPVCHPSGGVSLVLQSLVGARWSSSGHPTYVFSFLNALFVLASASTRRFGYSMLGFSVALLCFRHGLCNNVLRPLPCSLVCGLHCTGPTNVRQSQWETVISCAGGQVFLVRLGGASSAMRAIHVAAGCSVKEGSSISVSFWLRMPWSRGCWLSVTKRSVCSDRILTCRIKSICSPAKGGTGCYRFNYQPGS